MNIIIEELNATHDYVQYCNLLKQLTVIDTDRVTKEDFIKQLTVINKNPYHKIFVAILSGKIIGTITILIEPKIIHNFASVAHIEDVVVDINYRHYGVGSFLMNKAIWISKRDDYKCYKIILDCAIETCDFYKKFGFVVKENQMVLRLD